MSDLTRRIHLAETAAVNAYLAEQGQQPTSLRDRIAAALYAHDWPQPGGPWADATTTDRAGCLGLADAALAVVRAELEQQAAHVRADTVADVLERLEHSCGDTVHEQLLDYNPELRTLAEQAQARIDAQATGRAVEPSPYPPHTDYAIEVLADDGEWVGLSHRRPNIETARTVRDRLIARHYPEGARTRIVQWTDTATVVEIDAEPDADPQP